ncbi:hypothetical protein PIB30_096670 [Stylosanthes scabra]|uniref:Uncharacterized protein n=1 Tax=Stylosanthes scabra TaxID=79078 RepID=A0ABU6QYL3_9FABA|nr:hypothetical protein [Stylosanthes scabra]
MSYDEALRTFQRENQEIREARKRTESQLNHLTKLLQKFANQPTINPQAQAQPSAPSPLPSQPLPNPKGGINAVHVDIDNEGEDEEGENDWLYELLAELANSDESDDEEEDESEDEDEEEEEFESDTEEKEKEKVNDGSNKGKTFFIATLFSEGKTMKEEIPIKCEDPGPCLVIYKIRGLSILDCLCDSGACGNIIPFELYETLDLGPLKKTKEVFTTGDASIIPFLKTAEFKLTYYDEIFTFSVGSAIETFHLTPPPNLQKERYPSITSEQWENSGRKLKGGKEDRSKSLKRFKRRSHDVESDNSPTSKRKKKKVVLNPEKKKKEPDGSNVKKDSKKKKKELNEVKSEKKKPINCSGFSRLLGKLKVLKDVLCRNKSMDAHLVKNNSKWK